MRELIYLGALMSLTAKQRLLHRAAELLGPQELAVRLKVPFTLLDAWMRGLATMPDRKLLALADLLEKLGTPPRSGGAPDA